MKRPSSPFLIPLALLAGACWVLADEPVLPGSSFNGDHYETLWKKSPFAIATPETGPASANFQLVGIAQFDGVSYASLIDKQTQEHFILTSEKPVKNLTLVALKRASGGASAVIDQGGERFVLNEETAPPASAMAAPYGASMPNPAGNPSVGGVPPPNFPSRSWPRFHRPLVVVPPPPSNP